MPFTLAHPAVVVPLARRAPRWFELPALVVGSMSPDFEYFVYLRPVRTIGHDLIGIPLLCVPAGLLIYWLFEHVMKRPTVFLLPRGLRERLWPLRRTPSTGRIGAVVVSIALGAFSHIAWDAFTHENGWVVERWPMLSVQATDGPPVYRVLQHGSTVVGLALLAFWSWSWLIRQEPTTEIEQEMSDSSRVTIVVTMFLIAIAFATLVYLRSVDGPWAVVTYRRVVRFVIALLSALGLVALGYRRRGRDGIRGIIPNSSCFLALPSRDVRNV
jgi:hypothetical protein